jgi:KDO2-lipid IV(A) lauroyltransferase
MSVPWPKRARRAVRSAVAGAAVALVSLLPLSVALALGGLAGRLAFAFGGRSRRLGLAQLAQAFPERSPAEREAILRASFVHLARCALEVVCVRRVDPILERYVAVSPEVLALCRAATARGHGVVFGGGHVGNWELMARRLAREGVVGGVVARRGPVASLNDRAERMREEAGLVTVWREDSSAARKLIRIFRDGKSLGVLMDQDTRVQGVFVPFFGKDAFTPRAVGDLALRFRAPVLVATARRRPEGGHEIEAVEIPYDPDPKDREAEATRIVAAATAALEAAIRRSPCEWVWMHERWKTRPAAAELPSSGDGQPYARPGEASPVPNSTELPGK